MKALRFLSWLDLDAPVCIAETNGNIIFTGRCGDAPRWTWSGRNIVSASLGECGDTDEHEPRTDHDIMIVVTARHIKRKEI